MLEPCHNSEQKGPWGKDNNNYIPSSLAAAGSSLSVVSSLSSSSPIFKLSRLESAEDDLGGGYTDVPGCNLVEKASTPGLGKGESVMFVIYCLASSGKEIRESRER